MSESFETEIWLNGQAQPLVAGVNTLADFLAQHGVDAQTPGIAVAIGDRVVPRAAWAQTAVEPGQRIEVVIARQGG